MRHIYQYSSGLFHHPCNISGDQHWKEARYVDTEECRQPTSEFDMSFQFNMFSMHLDKLLWGDSCHHLTHSFFQLIHNTSLKRKRIIGTTRITSSLSGRGQNILIAWEFYFVQWICFDSHPCFIVISFLSKRSFGLADRMVPDIRQTITWDRDDSIN